MAERTKNNSSYGSSVDVMTSAEIAALNGEPAIIYNSDTNEYVSFSNGTQQPLGQGAISGLEAIDEGGVNYFGSVADPIGWRLKNRDENKYGNIGEGGVDFSTGAPNSQETLPAGGTIETTSTELGSTGSGAFTAGAANENRAGNGVVLGYANVNNGGPNIEPTYNTGTAILGSYNQSYGLNYNNFIAGARNIIGDRSEQSYSAAGFPSPYNCQYYGGQIGLFNDMPAGYASVQLGYGLLSSGPGAITVGVCNADETLQVAENITNNRNNLNPRFVVGTGTFAGTAFNPAIGTRANGFVVMSDGTAKFPSMTNAEIDASNDDSAVTKGWVNENKNIVADNVEAASAANEGTLRYTKTANSSAVEMSMQTGASTYAWVTIQSNAW